jgi:hypothetical protein
MERLKQHLTDLTKVDGISTAVVVSRDGFVISGVSNSTIDTEAVGALVSTGIGSAEVMGRELATGALTQGMFEYADGLIVMSALDADAVLAIVASPDANLGNIRYQVRKAAPQLTRAL